MWEERLTEAKRKAGEERERQRERQIERGRLGVLFIPLATTARNCNSGSPCPQIPESLCS